MEAPFALGVRVVHVKRGPGVVSEILPDGRTAIRFDAPDQGEHRYKLSSMDKIFAEDDL